MRRRVTPRFEPPPPPKPFQVLAKPRFVAGHLPSDLRRWYERHEGVGQAASTQAPSVRLHTLAELMPLDGADIRPEGGECPDWPAFRGYGIGRGTLTVRFVYVTQGTDFRFGSILALGANVPGHGLLRLAVNFTDWLDRLARDEWIEWGLTPAGWEGLPRGKVEALRRHFGRLNPPAARADSGGTANS